MSKLVQNLKDCYCKSGPLWDVSLALKESGLRRGPEGWQAVQGGTGTFHISFPLGQMKHIHDPHTTLKQHHALFVILNRAPNALLLLAMCKKRKKRNDINDTKEQLFHDGH